MDSSNNVLEVDKLFHSFKRHAALRGVSFTVGSNEIHGFVGPNGAGKTTTLKLIATLLKPQGLGSIKVFGHDVAKEYKKVRRQIGFMPDHFSMYKQMTVFEYLDFFAAAYGLNMYERDRTINDLLNLTDMSGRKDDLIKGLSRGMQQRVNLARVLVHDPQLLLLDEPASGLDPRARIELMEILRELKNMGKTIFISSHILTELADLCDSVTIVDVGKVKFSGSMKDLLTFNEEQTIQYRLHLKEEKPDLETIFTKHQGVTNVIQDAGGKIFRITIDANACNGNQILSIAIDNNAEVASFNEDKKHLNQAFMDLTEAGVRTK